MADTSPERLLNLAETSYSIFGMIKFLIKSVFLSIESKSRHVLGFFLLFLGPFSYF